MELRQRMKQRKRINNLPKFDGGKPSWLFSNPGLSYELPPEKWHNWSKDNGSLILDSHGFAHGLEDDGGPREAFTDPNWIINQTRQSLLALDDTNDLPVGHYYINYGKGWDYQGSPQARADQISQTLLNYAKQYGTPLREYVPTQQPQTAPKPIQQPVQVQPKPTVVYSESFRRPDQNTPDYYRAGSLAPQNQAYHPQTINTPDFQGPAPAKPQLIVKANSNYRRPTQIDPDKVANQASIDKAADPVPMREFTLPDTEVVSNMPDWKALGYTSKEAYDNVVKFGSTVLGKEQHKALTGQKIASVVGGVANLAQNYIGQQSAVKSTEELMTNAGTQNRSNDGVGYTRQNYANDSQIMSRLNKSGLSSTLSGVASGAAAGVPFGWIGAAAGAAIGGITGLVGWSTSRNAQRKRLNNARQLTGRINTGNQAGAMTTALQQNYYSQNGNTGGVLYT